MREGGLAVDATAEEQGRGGESPPERAVLQRRAFDRSSGAELPTTLSAALRTQQAKQLSAVDEVFRRICLRAASPSATLTLTLTLDKLIGALSVGAERGAEPDAGFQDAARQSECELPLSVLFCKRRPALL